jgi:murein DD-endopeptidase MepM/ murein hydrolase activator NlpD
VANGIQPDARLPVGRRLLIPTVIAARPDPSPAPTPAASAAPAMRFTWPVSGTLRRGFTARGGADYHDGIDIAVPVGTAVRAAEAGKVVFAGTEPSQFGNLVIVDHGGGWTSAYAFLSRITVKEGDAVRKDERVGLSGRTGRARGPELHFEVRRSNRPVDPRAQLSSGN